MKEGMQFEHLRGPYGEILPLALWGNYSPQEALDKMLADTKQMTGKEVKQPTRGRSLQGLYSTALIYIHQFRLREVIAGEGLESDYERALHEAVTLNGEAMSLRPLSRESLIFLSFAPVLKKEDGGWRMGDPAYGKSAYLSGMSAKEAVEQAQKLEMEWANADDEIFAQQITAAMNATPLSPYHDFWLRFFVEYKMFSPADGYSLYLLGSHNTMRLETPETVRVLDSDRLRGVRMIDALARSKKAAVVFPTAEIMCEWLAMEKDEIMAIPGEPAWPEADEPAWAENRTLQGLLANWRIGGHDYDLLRNGTMLQLVPLDGKSAYGQPAVQTGWETVFEEWMRDEQSTGREALKEYLLWKLQQPPARTRKAADGE